MDRSEEKNPYKIQLNAFRPETTNFFPSILAFNVIFLYDKCAALSAMWIATKRAWQTFTTDIVFE